MTKPQRLVPLVEQLRTVERLLISGCTLPIIADTIGASHRQVQRLVRDLKTLGVQVSSDFIPGRRAPATYRAKKSTAVFR